MKRCPECGLYLYAHFLNEFTVYKCKLGCCILDATQYDKLEEKENEIKITNRKRTQINKDATSR